MEPTPTNTTGVGFSVSPEEITIHAALADAGLWPGKNHKGQVCGHLAMQIYYYLRCNDPKGSGQFTLGLSETAQDLAISIYSVRRRMNWGLNLGLFRSVRRVGVGQYRIFYSSVENICRLLGIDDIGACYKIPAGEIPRMKFAATEAEALKLQKQSQYQEARKNPSAANGKIISPQEMTTSELGLGAILYRGEKFTFLKRNAQQYGGSQFRIAWEMGRSQATIQRRLDDSYRLEHGLDPIPKVQIAAAPRYITSHDQKIRRLAPGQLLIKTHLGMFRICANIYDIPDQLEPKRFLRCKIRRKPKPSAAILPEIPAPQNAILEALEEDYKEFLSNARAYRRSHKQSTANNSGHAKSDKQELSVEKIAPARATKKSRFD